MTHYLNRLEKQIHEHWNKKALCDYGGDSFTFGDVAERIARLHILFESFGLGKGDRIAICGRNQARWGICFLAANTYGAVLVPILADFTPDNICTLVNHSESVVLFTDPDIWSKLDKSMMPLLRQAISISDFRLLHGSDQDRKSCEDLDVRFQDRYPDGFMESDVSYPQDNDKDLAVINYTSGSTGDPKGVMIRYECFSANTEYGQKRIPSYPEDNILSILPMAHMFGMAFELIYPLCGGTAVYYLGRTPSPTMLLKAMKTIQPYLVVAVPMIFEKIYRSKLKPAIEKPSVRILSHIPVIRDMIYSRIRGSLDEAFGGKVRMYILGGAAVNPEVEAFLHKIKLHFTVGYGMTEAAPLLAYEDWDKFTLRSCGRAIDCVQLRIDSDDPANVVGEIQAKGINIFSGYFKNEKATRASFTEDGWFNTGDLGLIDAKGNVYIKGRSKSMLLSSNGQNIYPEELESIINNQPYVIESLVLSRDDKFIGLVLFDEQSIEKDGRSLSDVAEEVRKATNSKLPKYSQLSKIEPQKDPFVKTPKMSIKRFLYH